MEKNDKAPKRQDKEGDNRELIDKLNIVLDIEMEKSPDEIDIKKVNSVIQLLNILENYSDDVGDISKEEFAEKFLVNYNIPLKMDKDTKKTKSNRNLKIAITFCTLILIVGISNYVTVRAINKNIFTFAKENAYIFYYDVFGKSVREKTEVNNNDIIQEEIENEEMLVDLWEEAEKIVGLDFEIPQFIPEKLEAQKIHVQIIDENDFGISRQYNNEKDNVRFLLRTIGGRGKWISAIDEMKGLIIQKQVNNHIVSFYEINDAFQAVYQDENFIYIVETSMSQETLEKIVEEMR